MGTKYTGLLLLAVGLAVILIRSRLDRRVLRIAGLFSLTALIVASPWYLRNILGFGNPLFPFLFPSGPMSAERLAFYLGPSPDRPIWRDLILPLEATVLGIEGGPGYSASIGPLLLALSAGLFLSWRGLGAERRAFLQRMSAAVLTGWVLWALGAHLSETLLQSRLHWGFFPAWAALSAVGYELSNHAHMGTVRLSRVINALVIFIVVLSLFGEVVHLVQSDVTAVLLGLSSQQSFLESALGWYAPAMRRVRMLPSSARTVLLWEPRSLHCLPGCEPDPLIDRWFLLSRSFSGTGEILDHFKQKSYTHLLLYRTGMEFVRSNDLRYSLADWRALDDLLGRLIVDTDFDGVYTLYRIGP
jgi:hypothetical protein